MRGTTSAIGSELPPRLQHACATLPRHVLPRQFGGPVRREGCDEGAPWIRLPSMSERAETLATSFERANAQVVSFVELLSDRQWRTWCEQEGRTVAVVVYHIAAGYLLIGNIIHALANGLPLPAQTDADSFNARQAEQHVNCTPAEALDLLRRNGGHVAGMLRGLSDEQLGRSAISPRGRTLTIEDAVERGLVAHLSGHFETVREALYGVAD